MEYVFLCFTISVNNHITPNFLLAGQHWSALMAIKRVAITRCGIQPSAGCNAFANKKKKIKSLPPPCKTKRERERARGLCSIYQTFPLLPSLLDHFSDRKEDNSENKSPLSRD